MKAVDNWVVYLLRCSDQSLYCGVTNNLEKRLATHNHGKGARYTRTRLPVTLVATSAPMSKSAALKLEFRIKKTPRNRKGSKLESGIVLRNIENAQLLPQVRMELRRTARQIKRLCAKVDKVIKTLEYAR